jgi:ParB family chromosome partitioning protein
MSLKDLKARSDKALATIGNPPAADSREMRPTTTPGAAAFMQPTIDALNERAKAAEGQVEELRRKLALQPTEAALELLDQVPGRKRKLTPDEYAELKENLRINPLMHPVTVRALANGRYEIISGNNRTDIFKELGRKTIPITVVDIEDQSADRYAFFANLLQTPLPDFEKYLGFRRERDSTGATQKELARSAGVPESKVSMLFAFESLPARAQELIESQPHAIGMSCAADLARLTKEGLAEQVVEAVGLLVTGKVTQKEAVLHASRKPAHARRPTAAIDPVKIRAGRAEFCQYVSRDRILRIEFKSTEDRLEAEQRVTEVLQALAQESRKAAAK